MRCRSAEANAEVYCYSTWVLYTENEMGGGTCCLLSLQMHVGFCTYSMGSLAHWRHRPSHLSHCCARCTVEISLRQGERIYWLRGSLIDDASINMKNCTSEVVALLRSGRSVPGAKLSAPSCSFCSRCEHVQRTNEGHLYSRNRLFDSAARHSAVSRAHDHSRCPPSPSTSPSWLHSS